MVIVITGAIGIGKTTLCRKVLDIARILGLTCAGILTYKTVDSSITIEDVKTGKKESLASTSNIYSGPVTPKYFFNPEGIEFGIRAIENGISSSILLVDEIGRLEVEGKGFIRVIELVKAGKVKNCILVIRSELLSVFLPQFGGKPFVFETTLENREKLPQEIGKLLAGA